MGILGTHLEASSTQFDSFKEEIMGGISVLTGAATSIYMPLFSTDDYAPAYHNHTGYAPQFSTSDYAPSIHDHNYSPVTHFHIGEYSTVHAHPYAAIFSTSDYAITSHNHDYSGMFAPIGAASSNHLHTGYALIGQAASSDHLHTSVYSSIDHTHVGSGGTQYTLQVTAANLATVVDATTYYIGAMAGLAPQTVGGSARLYIPKTGNVKKVYAVWRSATAGTAENITCYVRKNNTSDTLVYTASTSINVRTFVNNNMTVAVTEGDYIELKFVCPTWATNPATLSINGVIYIE